MKAAFSEELYASTSNCESDEEEMTLDECQFIVENSHIDLPSFSEYGNEWLGCAAHALQLVVKDGLTEMRGYTNASNSITKCSSIAQLHKKSSSFRYSTPCFIPQACTTRWNSNMRLIEAVDKNFEIVNQSLPSTSLRITCSDLNILNGRLLFLRLFQEATDILQASKQPTLPHMVPIIQQLENALLQSSPSKASINAFRIRLLNSLRKRFDYLKITSLHVVETILDPSTKLSFAEHSITDTSRHFTFDYSKSRQMVLSYFIAKVKECDVMNIECHDSSGPSSPKILKLSDFSLRKTTTEVTNNKDSWKKLFECYLDTP